MSAQRRFCIGLLVTLVLGSALYTTSARNSSKVPAFSYKSLVPGESSFANVVAKMGQSPIDTESAGDLRYPSTGQPTLTDRFYFRDNKLALVTSASTDVRYPNQATVEQKLGQPEARIVFQTQEYADYTEKGLRFIFDGSGRTTGILYFQPQRRRIPAGYPNEKIVLRRELPAPQPATPPSDFRVGVSQLSIAPQRFDNVTADGAKNPMHLAEDLLARIVIFERGETKVVFAGVDVFGMGPWDISDLQRELKKQGYDHVIFAMSHTHANVDTVGFYGYYPREYSKYVIQQTIKAVVNAGKAMVPVKELKMGTVEMPLAGGQVKELIRNGRDPGVVDPTVALLQAVGLDGRPVANLIHLACHPEVIRLKNTMGLSPDYVGRLCRDVTSKLGGQTVFLNGSLGGMLTPGTRFRTQDEAEEMGRQLADYVYQAAQAAQPTSNYNVWIHRRPVIYPVVGTAVSKFMQNTPEPTDFYQGRVETEMNAIWIGDAQFITVPGELLPDLGFEIMSHMSGRLRLIVGLANGELGYLIPSFDFRDGGYEERTGPGAAGGEITRTIGLELAPMKPTN